MKIKQLDWYNINEKESIPDWEAHSVIGDVNIWVSKDNTDEKINYAVIFEADSEEGDFDNLESAKAFAQSHHEELVRKTIDDFVEE